MVKVKKGIPMVFVEKFTSGQSILAFRYNSRVLSKIKKSSIIILSILLISACGPKEDIGGSPTLTSAATPTATEAPMAARVDGTGILLSDYQAEMKRYQAALAELAIEEDAADSSKAVLDELVNQALLVNAAAAQNYTVDDAMLEEKISKLADESGGIEALQTWMAENAYDEQSFRETLRKWMAATWMQQQIISAVPVAAEQVRARQILVKSENEANAVLRQLQAGTTFETLAFQYDPLTGGELGWFPRTYLLQPAVEEAAFTLQPGGFSGIIQTSYGYHIVQVIERDSQHPLSSDALIHLKKQAMVDWLGEQRSQAAVEILVP